MSRPAVKLRILQTHDRLAGMVRVGLMEFWSQALPADSPLLLLLQNEALQRLELEDASELCWEELYRKLEADWPLLDAPFGQLIGDLNLALPEAFLLSLVGEVETSHLINMVLSELQAPTKSARPTVHLCIALQETLFGSLAIHIQDLLDGVLLQQHLLQLEGDGPTPLRQLRMHPSLWAVLCDRARGWPSCHFLNLATENVLPSSMSDDVPRIASLLASGRMKGIAIRGNPHSGRGFLAAEWAQVLGMQAMEIPVATWEQQPALSVACKYAEWLPVLRPQLGPGEVWRVPKHLLQQPLVVLLGADGAVEATDLLELELKVPNQDERSTLWACHLKNTDLAAETAATALLSGPSIVEVAGNALLLAERANENPGIHHIAEARRELGAERLRLLAQPVRRCVTAEALVTSPLVTEALDTLIQRARRRESLWQGLGATMQATHNAGVRGLFVGESGTGKTLAASYIATSLGAPLYRVDLAAVMNKYIGESEKNLASLLDQAATSDVVLLFDEADSLFGQRSEGKETGERYANMLTNFLLTRIENHPGIVILTTNSRERIDNAFTRRLDMIIEFPLPGFEERLQLWHTHLGDRGPGQSTYRFLASFCELAGGQVRNVVISAAAHARDEKIETADLLQGLQAEYRKLGRSLPPKLEQLNISTKELS